MSAENVLVALADPTRRQVLELLSARRSATATTLGHELPITRQAVLKHLGVLSQCGLVSGTRSGRELFFRVRSEPLMETAAWMTALAAQWDDRLHLLKARAEAEDDGVPGATETTG